VRRKNKKQPSCFPGPTNLADDEAATLLLDSSFDLSFTCPRHSSISCHFPIDPAKKLNPHAMSLTYATTGAAAGLGVVGLCKRQSYSTGKDSLAKTSQTYCSMERARFST